MAFLVACLISFAGGALLGGRGERPADVPPRLLSVASTPRPAETSAPAPVPPPARTAPASAQVPQPARRTPAPVPTKASGKFVYAAGTGRTLGRKGSVRPFHVAVERGSGQDVGAFAAEVEATLGDSRSWVGDGSFRLRRVPHAEPADFTVFLATRYAAGKMCALGGADIKVSDGLYTSCRTTGRAIINLDRWRLSAPPYLAADVSLTAYRQYVINHEVGHEFGHHHQGCPKDGGPAPVMMQQTLTLRGCQANPWPRVRHRELTGPPV
jgi:hypothetical protein